MANMNKTEAFKKLGANQKNTFWSVSAFNQDKQLVLSLWKNFFRTENRKAIYSDSISRWHGHGNKEFRENLLIAYEQKMPIRAVIVRTNNIEGVKRGEDASKFTNTFSPKLDWIGEITFWDGENFEITFVKITK